MHKVTTYDDDDDDAAPTNLAENNKQTKTNNGTHTHTEGSHQKISSPARAL